MSPARTASPILRAIFDQADAERVPIAELARRIGGSPQGVQGWRSGKNAPSVFAVEELAAALGCRLALVPADTQTLEDRLRSCGVVVSFVSSE
jgi:transcriptional regulator with XRE-family HTH domain